MENWLESVYSDGTAMFVSNPSPKLSETVTVRMPGEISASRQDGLDGSGRFGFILKSD